MKKEKVARSNHQCNVELFKDCIYKAEDISMSIECVALIAYFVF